MKILTTNIFIIIGVSFFLFGRLTNVGNIYTDIVLLVFGGLFSSYGVYLHFRDRKKDNR